MAELYTYDGTHLTTIRDGTVRLTQSAELGAIGTGSLAIDDTAGTLAIVGQKDFSVTQSSCSFPLTFRGFIEARSYGRDAGTERKPHVGAARGIGVSVEDINALTGHIGITDTDGNRKQNDDATVADRLTWLLASDYAPFIDNGRVTYSTAKVTKANYRNQFAGDVLADLALAAGGFNYYIADWGSGPELVFRDDNVSTADSSTLRISNVLADASSVTLHPFKDATLRRSPNRVKSKIAYTWALSPPVIEERAATATAFNGERFGVSTNANIATATQASREARQELWQLHTEDDLIECTVLATSAQVNLILHGMRLQAKFSHLATEGYGSFTWFRVLERTYHPIVADGALVELGLKLSPQEAGNSDICLYDDTADGAFYPLGGGSNGDISNASDGTVYYLRPGQAYPDYPAPGQLGRWHFPTYGTGGAGTIDYFASGFQNELRFVVVGNGTLTIDTEQWLGQNQPYTIIVHQMVDGNAVGVGSLQTGTAGDTTVVTVTTADAPDCVHVIRLRADARVDGSYIGMGWSAATWVGA